MADKSIVELGIAQQMTDDALLPVYQGGETKSIEGALIKKYAKDFVRQYVDGAKQSADEAAVSAAAAKTAREGVEAYADQAGQSAAQSAGSAATAQGAATAADASKTAAAGSATAAQKSASDAQASKTAAGKSETNAAGSAAAADKSKVDAQAAQRAAESAKTAAESSAILAGGKAAEAGQKATEAGNSASAAAESAAAAAKSKTDAEAAKTAAQTAKTEAEAARTASETAKTTAQTAQGKAEAARDAAEVSAASAADSSTAAGASATAAAASAQTAIAKAGEASTSAGAAKTSETNAKKSETAAGLSADAAEQARQAIEALGVQGVTLAAGSQVAVEKVVASDGTVTLKFSIPQGAKGDKGSTGDRGVSISTIERTAGTGAAGTTDTYTITLSDGSTSTFAVYNGRDGEGSGDMAASVYDPAGKSSQVATEAELEALPVKHLVGTDAAPVNLDDLLEPGIYYITGTQTTTKDACGLLDSAYVQSPLVVIGTTQRRHSNIGAGVRGRVFLNGMTIKIPPMDFMFKEKGVLTGNIDMGTHKITNLPAPTVDEDAATKGYVDTGLAEKSDTNHTHTADDVSFADGETFQAKLDAGKLNGADGKSAYQQAVDAGYTGTEAAFYAALASMKDAPFLPKSGGTMMGDLNMGSWLIKHVYLDDVGLASNLSAGMNYTITGLKAPADPADAANKAYVDAETAKCLPLAGGTMTGDLNVEFNGINLAYGTRIFTSGDIEDLCIMANSEICFYDKNWGKASLNNVRRIYGLEAPTGADQAANRAYVDSKSIQYGTCATSAATAAKVVTLSGFALSSGAMVLVKFTYANTNTTATLNVNGTGAKSIRVNGAAIKNGMIAAGMYALFEYDGTYWQLLNPTGGGAEIVTGSYTGSGAASRTISLGFTPSAVLISQYGSFADSSPNSAITPACGLALTSLPAYADKDSPSDACKICEIVDNGFKVFYSTSGKQETNSNSNKYHYIALRG